MIIETPEFQGTHLRNRLSWASDNLETRSWRISENLGENSDNKYIR